MVAPSAARAPTALLLYEVWLLSLSQRLSLPRAPPRESLGSRAQAINATLQVLYCKVQFSARSICPYAVPLFNSSSVVTLTNVHSHCTYGGSSMCHLDTSHATPLKSAILTLDYHASGRSASNARSPRAEIQIRFQRQSHITRCSVHARVAWREYCQLEQKVHYLPIYSCFSWVNLPAAVGSGWLFLGCVDVDAKRTHLVIIRSNCPMWRRPTLLGLDYYTW